MYFKQKGFEIILNKKTNSTIPVVKFSYPIQKALKIEDNKLSMILLFVHKI